MSTEPSVLNSNETLFDDDKGLTDPSEILLQQFILENLKTNDMNESFRFEKRLKKLEGSLINLLPDVHGIHYGSRHNKPVVLFQTSYGDVTSSELSSGYSSVAA